MRLALALLVVGRAALAQCPDGSPPPCASRAVARPVDPNRIAVLPFRVTTSDTLLGEGFAELLATELSAENGPRALDMGTVISTWRRAGGGLRTPLTRDRALAMARELGAGLVSEGSIVGLGSRLTITTSIVSSTNGAPRGRPTVVRTSADSIDHALRQTASGLVAALGGEQRSLEGARYTESPEAMRHYLTAMNLWRRGRIIESQSFLERAMSLDTTFAQAAFRSHLANGWGAVTTSVAPAAVTQRAFSLRERLSPPERAMLEGLIGPRYPAERSVAERIEQQMRVASLLPENPVALYLAGDAWFHVGTAVDPIGQLERARDLMTRSAGIDSQATVLRHLIDVAIRMRDTATLRQTLRGYARHEDSGRWPGLWLGWSILDDEAELAALRRTVSIDRSQTAFWPLFAAATADVSAARFDEMVDLWSKSWQGDPLLRTLHSFVGTTLAARGRTVAAERQWALLPMEMGYEHDRLRLMFGLVDRGAGLDVAGAVARMADRFAGAQAPSSPGACEFFLYQMKTDAPVGDTSGKFTGSCGRTLRIASADLSTPDGLRILEESDSTLRVAMPFGRGYESYYLAHAWERLGRRDRALRALRYNNMGSTYLVEAPWIGNEEVRLALAIGDTTNAVRKLEFYLGVIRDPDEPHIARRDSLRVLLNQLRRRSD